MKTPQIRQLSVRKLRQLLVEKAFAVPKLQREFVWNGKRAAVLMDSLYRHMPIGSILVWEAKPENYDLLRQALHILPPFDTQRKQGWFLIDGQQRLSVIHRAFEGGMQDNGGYQAVDFGRICFVVDPDEADDDATRFVFRVPVHRKFARVQDILASDWRRRHRGYTQPLLKQVNDCRRRLLGYKVPVVVVQSDDIEEIREVFLRINSQGMTLGAADRAFARASSLDLRDLAHVLRNSLNPAFHDLDLSVILQGFAFVTHERDLDVGERALEATVKWWEAMIDRTGKQGAFFSRWADYRTAFGKAENYLHQHFGVHHSGFLPSQNMLSALSVFFFHHPAAPSTKHAAQIRKWFWATGIALRYSGRGYRQNLISDVKFFQRLARSGRARFELRDRVDRGDVLRAEYTQRSSLVNTVFCLLAVRNPCFIENGQPLPSAYYATRANRRDRHHIFPRKLLANSGFGHREYNSICNICFVVAEENQGFGMKRPDSYLAEYQKRKHFGRAMKSHLIPHDAESGLWTKGVSKAFKQFKQARLRLICRSLEREAGLKIFRRG